MSSGGTCILSLRLGLEDQKQGILVQIVIEHVGSQSDDISSGGTCLLSLWLRVANRKRDFVVLIDNKCDGVSQMKFPWEGHISCRYGMGWKNKVWRCRDANS